MEYELDEYDYEPEYYEGQSRYEVYVTLTHSCGHTGRYMSLLKMAPPNPAAPCWRCRPRPPYDDPFAD